MKFYNKKTMRIVLLFLFGLLSISGFCQSSDASLTTQANVIRNETSPGANTRARIANMYQSIIDSKISRVDDIVPYLSLTPTISNDGQSIVYNHSTGLYDFFTPSSGASVSGFTNGSVLFTTSEAIDEDNSNLFWDDSNNRLGILTNTPSTPLQDRKSVV